jgi:hypothetical protein
VTHVRAAGLVTLAAVLAGGCDARKAAVPQADQAPAAVVRQMAAPAPVPQAPAAAVPAAAEGGSAAGLQAMAASRKLIRTGQMTLVVKDYLRAAAEVKRIAETNGGYLAEAQGQRGAQDRRHGSLTIRVDAGRFDDAVAALRALGDVRSENLGTQDVTKAYTDLETRLRVKRDTAERLREILRTRTAKLSDVLEAERELARVTEEIEQMEGERRFYDQQIALSTLTVALQEPAAIVEAGVFSPISEAMRDSLRVLAASFAALIYAAVFLAPWLLLAWIGWKLYRRIRARRAAAATQP